MDDEAQQVEQVNQLRDVGKMLPEISGAGG